MIMMNLELTAMIKKSVTLKLISIHDDYNFSTYEDIEMFLQIKRQSTL